jgi:D-galactarolactone cycloisomerase
VGGVLQVSDEVSLSGSGLTELTIDHVEIFAFRVPVAQGRRARYGNQSARTALIVKLLDGDGCWGWGECFTNWPTFGVEHRARIASDILTPLVKGFSAGHPEDLSAFLHEQTAIMRIKSNENGPFEQVIAAFDIALWDLWARRLGEPLHRLLGGAGDGSARIYASGLTSDNIEQSKQWAESRGVRAYKLKVGFGLHEDKAALDQLIGCIGTARLMVDADQAWDVDAAVEATKMLSAFDVDWLEEPLRADRPLSEWKALAEQTDIPLAAGENIRGETNFDAWAAAKVLKILQPDPIKWGGISQVRNVWAKARATGLRVCPHYLGGGIGLLATAHLAAAMGDDLLEFDVSENPLRFALAEPFPEISNGVLKLSQVPGLGVEPDLAALAAWRL